MTVEARWTWTNWTFGVWWDLKRLRAFGLDVGPFELMCKLPRRVGPGHAYRR